MWRNLVFITFFFVVSLDIQVRSFSGLPLIWLYPSFVLAHVGFVGCSFDNESIIKSFLLLDDCVNLNRYRMK